MNSQYLCGESNRAARFEHIRIPVSHKRSYKGVPQVDLSILQPMERFHVQPANSVDHSFYVKHTEENPEEFFNGVPIYNVEQTEDIQPSNANHFLFKNKFDPRDRGETPRQSILGKPVSEKNI